MKKYELLSEDSLLFAGSIRLYRIRSLRDFGSVKRGAVGGYVESEKNLSHDGTAWIADQAKVMGGARVEGNAEVRSHALISGNVTLSEDVCIGGWVQLTASGHISGNVLIRAEAPDPGAPPPVPRDNRQQRRPSGPS